ncbi:hypothetical protein GEMRC1_007143 [Eukaryota sp. GEM-RC1]
MEQKHLDCQFWIDNPIFPTEVANAIARLPKRKAAGPSGISFDLLKAACKSAPELSEDLATYFPSFTSSEFLLRVQGCCKI